MRCILSHSQHQFQIFYYDLHSSPCGLCVGLGLSSTTDCISGWSLTTMRGGRSLLSIWALSWFSVEAPSACFSSPSLSVSDASPGTWRQTKTTDKADSGVKVGGVETLVEDYDHTLLSLSQSRADTQAHACKTTLVPPVAVWGAPMEVM